MVTKMKEEEIKVIEDGNIRSHMEWQRANRDYLRSNYQDLLRKHRNQWVVISGGKLIKSERNPDRLLEALALSKTKRTDMLVFYLADPEDFMLL